MTKASAGRHRSGFEHKLIPLIEQVKVSLVKKTSSLIFAYDVEETVTILQQRFPAFRRQKLMPFRRSVEDALRIMKTGETPSVEEDMPPGKRARLAEADGEVEDATQEAAAAVTAASASASVNLLNSSLQKSYSAQNAAVPSDPATPKLAPQRQETPASSQKRKQKRSGNADEEGASSKRRDGGSTGKFDVTRPNVRYSDLGGIESCLQDIRELIEYPLTHPEIYTHLGVEPPRGILLHGPPGCGKTLLANAIAGELGVPFLKVSAPELVSGMSGESEARIRDLFEEAIQLAPCIIFIDEIDAIVPKRETAQREMERRIVAQLLISMEAASMERTGNRAVCVIGATNRPDSIDAALRRAGRFDREISMGIPDEAARERILKVLTKKLRLSGDFDFRYLAKASPGFVGADLQALAKEAAVIAVNRIFTRLDKERRAASENISTSDVAAAQGPESMDLDGSVETANTPGVQDITSTTLSAVVSHSERHGASEYLRSIQQPLSPEQLDKLCITMEDFVQALKIVQPSSKREGFATIPDTTWEDIGALDAVREELVASIVEPIRFPEKFERMGIAKAVGVLLYGPPGCGKTLLAKAIANESRANFISVKGPELLNKYVGESERAVRQLFQRAASSAPCVIFFDELDALVPKRGTDSSSSQASERVVNQLLTEMDGLEQRKSVFVIAATNRPDIIDAAMLRPGRLDKLLYVGLPTPQERIAILKTLSQRTPIHPDVSLESVALNSKCNGFTGADLAALVREAAVLALRESIAMQESSNADVFVCQRHFDLAFTKVYRSVSRADQREYEQLQRKLRSQRSHLVHPSSPEEDSKAVSGTGNNNSRPPSPNLDK